MIERLGHHRLGQYDPPVIRNLLGDRCRPEEDHSGLCGENGKLGRLLDVIMSIHEGQNHLQDWIQCDGISITISEEMDDVKAAFNLNVTDITPHFIDTWTIEDTITSVARSKAPFLLVLLTHLARRASRARKIRSRRAIR